jgi:16S rRNA pseudouridine516 synthase
MITINHEQTSILFKTSTSPASLLSRERMRQNKNKNKNKNRNIIVTTVESKKTSMNINSNDINKLERVDRLISNLGYCDRSQVQKQYVNRRRLTLVKDDGDGDGDGEGQIMITSTSQKVNSYFVRVDGQKLEDVNGILFIYYKPTNCVCSKEEQGSNVSVYDELRRCANVETETIERWLNRVPAINSVGRLDKDTTGLLLFTDCGKLLHAFTSKKVEKVYKVKVDSTIPTEAIAIFASGKLQIAGELKPCLPARLEINKEDQTKATIVLNEGKFHQVKKMFASVGCQVLELHRSKFSEYELPDEDDEFKPGMVQKLDITKAREMFYLN